MSFPVLAGAVLLASFSCACAAPVPEPASGPAPHHAHHQDAGAVQHAECAETGCGGNGVFDAVLPEPSPAAVPEMSFDESAATAPALADLFGSPAATLHRYLPPPGLRRALPTPVSRFEKLLN